MTTATIDRDHVARRLREMLQGGRVAAARPLLAALRELAPDSTDLVELEARLLLREGQLHQALALLDRGVADQPDSVVLRICRADARMQDNNTSGAAADAAEAIVLSPGSHQAKALLGVALIELGQTADAVACLREAVADAPACAAYWQGLAEALERGGDAPAATVALQAGIAAAPENIALRTAAIMTAMRGRDFAAAIAIAETARRDGMADACVFGLLGHARSNLGDHAGAMDAYQEALKLSPEDPYVRHLVSAGGVRPNAARAPLEYLEAVFDGYAPRFEDHIIGLGYRAPGLIRAALLRHVAPGPDTGPILDLGCGTGLMAVALSDLPLGPIIGVDISGGMLEQAAGKGLYAALHRADLLEMLTQAAGAWRILLAADVFCYTGDLAPALRAAHAALRPDGIFIFSVEECAAPQPGESWRLGAQGRYSHDAAYIAQAAITAGFIVTEFRRDCVRQEAGAPVAGLVVVLTRRAGHG